MATDRTQAIRVHRFGGPEVLQWDEVDLPAPAADEVRIRQTAVGLNFIDAYHRSGLYPLELPAGIGAEAAGMVELVGSEVEGLVVGDWVAYVGLPPGAYSERRNWPAARLVKLPEGITDDLAAAVMLKGLTAWYLARRSYKVQPDDTVLLYAAAGGTGTLLAQWASTLGARVIGVAGSEAKAQIARACGCAETLLTNDPEFVKKVRDWSDGGVSVVYDSIGKDTFMDSLACLRPLGMMVSFGNASGVVPPFDTGILSRLGSLFLTRPTLFAYAARRGDLLAMAAELFEVVVSGKVRIEVAQRYPLREAAQAHRDLEARRTTGSTVLTP